MELFHKTLRDAKRKIESGDFEAGRAILAKHFRDTFEFNKGAKQSLGKLFEALNAYKTAIFGAMSVKDVRGGPEELKKRLLGQIEKAEAALEAIKVSTAEIMGEEKKKLE